MTPDGPIPADLIARLRERAVAAEAERNVPFESIAELQEAGLFRIWRPRSRGGCEGSARSHLDAISAIGAGCASTAWVSGVYHAHNWLLSHFPPAAQEDVWGADDRALASAVITPRGRARRNADGGYTLDGVWPFCSGVRAAQWVILGAEVFDTAGDKIGEGEFLLPVGDFEVLDDWRAAGLAGTGSHTLRAREAAVPTHRFLGLPELVAGQTAASTGESGPLYRSPAVPLLTLALTGASLGAARGAIGDYVAAVAGKAVAYTGHRADEWPVRQVQLGQAAARVEAAALLLYRCADMIDVAAASGLQVSVLDRARARLDCAQAVRFCMEAVDSLWLASGGAGVALAAPLQRAARDLHAINNHGLLALDVNAELYGMVLSGKAPNTPLL